MIANLVQIGNSKGVFLGWKNHRAVWVKNRAQRNLSGFLAATSSCYL